MLFFDVGGPILQGDVGLLCLPVVIEQLAQINGGNATLAQAEPLIRETNISPGTILRNRLFIMNRANQNLPSPPT